MEKNLKNSINNDVDESKDNTSLDDKESQEKSLEQREMEINRRELMVDFSTNISDDLKSLNIEGSQDLKDSIVKLIDFTDKDAFNSSYENVIEVLKNVKLKSKESNYRPRTGQGGNRNDFIKDAFKPPKFY